jgi:hypothetical protein
MNLNLSVNKLVAVICFPPHLLLLKCPPNFVRTLTNALPGSLREGSVFQAFLKILLTAGEYLTHKKLSLKLPPSWILGSFLPHLANCIRLNCVHISISQFVRLLILLSTLENSSSRRILRDILVLKNLSKCTCVSYISTDFYHCAKVPEKVN